MNVRKLIQALEEMGELLELDGANPFKAGAYPKAARILREIGEELYVYIEENRLTEIVGIGQGLAEKIREFHEHGKITELEELRARIPQVLVQITRIPGVGPRKARVLHRELGIGGIDDLRKAVEEGKVAELKGFGEKTAQKILAGIEELARYTGRHRLDRASVISEEILDKLRAHKAVDRAESAGSLRRCKETVGDLDFVVATSKPEEVMEFFVNLPEVENVLGRGGTKSSVMTDYNIQADLRCVPAAEFPFTLFHFTGSKEHNTRLRARAKGLGLKLNEYGLFPEGGDKSLKAKSEEDIYAHLKLQYIPPEMREDRGEIEAAAESALPRVVTRDDIRGMIHMHTEYSDGKVTLEQYAEWAAANGIAWMGISDHSQSLTVANGLKEDRVLRQHEEIDALNRRFATKKVRLLKGIESDILADGSLDYPDDFLANFEFVIASVHSRFNLTGKEQTARMIRAIEHPRTTILGHMTGRLLLEREGYAIDQKAVIRAAALNRVAIEINANPWRLDMDWRLIPYALEQGVKLCISPDAHVIEGLDDFRFGLAMARKGWATKDVILNCLSVQEFIKHAQARAKG